MCLGCDLQAWWVSRAVVRCGGVCGHGAGRNGDLPPLGVAGGTAAQQACSTHAHVCKRSTHAHVCKCSTRVHACKHRATTAAVAHLTCRGLAWMGSRRAVLTCHLPLTPRHPCTAPAAQALGALTSLASLDLSDTHTDVRVRACAVLCCAVRVGRFHCVKCGLLDQLASLGLSGTLMDVRNTYSA